MVIKKRISMTLDKDLLKKVDEMIDDKYIRNRSQAFEVILMDRFLKEKIRKAVILAGGLRLKTNFIPLKKIHGKPLISHQIENLKNEGINEIYIAAYPITSKIFETVGDGSSFGLKINFLEERKPLGTAGATKLAGGYVDSNFVLIYGDVYFDFSLNKMLDFHKERGALATTGITIVDKKFSTDNIQLEGNKIKYFKYAPKLKTFITNIGIYVFSPEIFDYIPDEGSLEEIVLPKLAEENKLFGYPVTGNWKHIK